MRILLVTSNEGKFREVRAALEKRGHEVVWRKVPYPEIQTASLDEVVQQGLARNADSALLNLLVRKQFLHKTFSPPRQVGRTPSATLGIGVLSRARRTCAGRTARKR